jgi:anti-sigma factor RsiW
MSASPLTCQELIELVTNYFEDALTPAERERFEEHLAICPGCVTYVEQFRETIRLTGSLREEDVPVPARDELLAQFRDWNESAA